jgi:hypothetical protein
LTLINAPAPRYPQHDTPRVYGQRIHGTESNLWKNVAVHDKIIFEEKAR